MWGSLRLTPINEAMPSGMVAIDYRNLENFRVQKFLCNKFSCEKIFVRYATARKLNARNIFLLDVYMRWRNTRELAVSADTSCTKESGMLLLARY